MTRKRLKWLLLMHFVHDHQATLPSRFCRTVVNSGQIQIESVADFLECMLYRIARSYMRFFYGYSKQFDSRALFGNDA
jgi:hypothetical protein